MGVSNMHSPNDDINTTNHKNDQTPLSPQQKQQQDETRQILKEKTKAHNSEKLINELIIEYFQFQGLKHTLSVFLSESNINSKLFKKEKEKQISQINIISTNNNDNQNNNPNSLQNTKKQQRKKRHYNKNLGDNTMPRDILTKRLGIIENDNSRRLYVFLNFVRPI